MGTKTLAEALGVSSIQKYKLDGTNYDDAFPVMVSLPTGAGAPDQGTITVRGVAISAELWAETEHKSVKIELLHKYKDASDIEIHIRFTPATNNAGIVNFTYVYYVMHKDGTTSAGGTVNFSKTVAANSLTNNIGYYIGTVVTGTNFVYGDMLIGELTRTAGTLSGDIDLNEIGCHIPIGQVGSTL